MYLFAILMTVYKPTLPSGKIGEGAPSPIFPEGRGVYAQTI